MIKQFDFVILIFIIVSALVFSLAEIVKQKEIKELNETQIEMGSKFDSNFFDETSVKWYRQINIPSKCTD